MSVWQYATNGRAGGRWVSTLRYMELAWRSGDSTVLYGRNYCKLWCPITREEFPY